MRRYFIAVPLAFISVPFVLIALIAGFLAICLVVSLMLTMFFGVASGDWFVDLVNDTIVLLFNNHKTETSWLLLAPCYVVWLKILNARFKVNKWQQ